VRPLDSPTAEALAGTEAPMQPFWSPDSHSIGFFADGMLKRIDVTCGPVITLAKAPIPWGGSWSPEGVIIFAGTNGALQRVAATGGVPTEATSLEHDHRSHHFPWFLPDGRHFLLTARTQLMSTDEVVCLGSLESREVRPIGVEAGALNVAYASGYLLYMREYTLMARPFDQKRLATSGDAVPLAEQVNSVFPGDARMGIFSVARDGLLAYQAGPTATGQELTWFDRSGKPAGTLGEPGEFWSVDFSPDHKRVAVTLRGQNDDIWIYDVARALPTRITVSPAAERNPVWSPDGRSIAYFSNDKVSWDLYRKLADGTGNEEVLYSDKANKVPTSWSRDGKFLLFWRNDVKTTNHIWVLPMGEPTGATPKAFPWLGAATQFNELMAKFSPDGHWVAYQSNRSGRFEIYVAPFSEPGGKHTQVSNGGGGYPRWRADGNEIFYELNGTLMAAEVSIKGRDVQVGTIRSLGIPVTAPHYRYDVSSDGNHFLVATPREQKSPAPLTLVQNWTALLKRQ
jgi:dipeptidyl aminopeptidase/acylaminoacyl peptidase